MKLTVVAALALAVVFPATPTYAAFIGHYAVPMNDPLCSYSTTSSVPVGNWTLSSAVPTTVAQLYRSPDMPEWAAEGLTLVSLGGAVVKLSIKVPKHGVLECLAGLQWSASLQPGGEVWLRDGDGLQLLADSTVFPVGVARLHLVPGEPLELLVSGAPQAMLSLQAVNPLPSPADAEVGPPTAVAAVGAMLNGRVFYWQLPTQMWFEWGWADFSNRLAATASYATACGADIQAELTGLNPGSSYRYRVAASNEAGIVRSEPMDLTTASRPGAARVGLSANGACLVDYDGTPAAAYSVWSSTNLVHWQRLGPGSEIYAGHFRFADDRPLPSAWRFYRVSSP